MEASHPSDQALSFGILGPLLVARGQDVIPVSSAKQRRLLAALLLTPGAVVTADRLEWVLWGDEPPRTARKTLHTLVSRLRRELGTDSVATRPPGYAIEVAAGQVDAGRFEAQVQRALALSTEQPEAALVCLDEAEALWRGPALAEVRDEEFAAAEALRLDELRVAARELRFDVLLALGRHAAAIPLLEGFLAEHEYRERPHGQLMLALYRAGRAPDALRVFQTFRERLLEELGLDPSPDLQELETRILQQDPSLDAAEAFDPAPTPRSAPPAAATPIVGREAELAVLAGALGRARVVTVVGPPGVGKTRLAMAHAAAAEVDLGDGVRWCELGELGASADVAEAVVAMLGLRRRSDASPTDLLAAGLAGRELLLVLDNCEHVIDQAGALAAAIARHCPTVAVLATSREPLGLIDEHVVTLDPLPPATAAFDLFAARAAAAAQSFAVDETNGAAIAAICRRLDGLPLAIELAAAQVRSFTPQEILDGLDDRFSALGERPRAAVARHRSLAGALDWSYDRLSDAEQRLFAALTAFSGGFRLEGAAAMSERLLGDPRVARRLVPGLVEKSLVTATHRGGTTRYGLLETLAAFGRERLAERGLEAVAYLAHADWALQHAEVQSVGLAGPAEAAAVAELDAELGNLRAAHARAVDAGDAGRALRLSVALHRFAYQRLRDEVFDWAEAAAALPDADRHELYPAGLGSLAQGLANRGDLKRATDLADAGLAAAGDRDAAALYPLHALGIIALYRGELDDARARAGQEVELAERVGDAYQAAFGQLTDVLARCYGGAPDEAALGKLHRLADRSSSPSQLAWAEYASGETRRVGDAAAALDHLNRAIDLGRTVDNDFVVGVALLSISDIRAEHGEPDIALAAFARIVEHWAARGVWTHQLTTLRNLVVLLVRIGRVEEAAWLAGAVADTEGTPAFGTSARRLAAAQDGARARLGDRRYRAAVERGRSLSQAEVVAQARAALAELSA